MDDVPTQPAFPVQPLDLFDVHERPTVPTHVEELTSSHELFAEGEALDIVYARQTMLLRFVTLVTLVCTALAAAAYLS